MAYAITEFENMAPGLDKLGHLTSMLKDRYVTRGMSSDYENGIMKIYATEVNFTLEFHKGGSIDYRNRIYSDLDSAMKCHGRKDVNGLVNYLDKISQGIDDLKHSG